MTDSTDDNVQYDYPDPNLAKFPRMIIAGLSFACNAKCIHCVYDRYPDTKKNTAPGRVFMDPDVFKAVADECSQYPWALLRVVGFGEPLMHPQAVELIKYAKDKGCNVGVITNGSLLDQKIAEGLIDAGIDAIDISVDARTPETYERIREGLKFDTLLENVKRLVAIRNAKKSKTFIFGSIVEQKDVMHELDDALEFWGGILDKVVSRKFLTFGLMDPDHERTPYYSKRHPCFLLYDRINIDVGGRIRQCGYDSFGETDLGTIGETTIAQAWQSDKQNAIRDAHQRGDFEAAGLCAKCVDWPFHSWQKNYMTEAFKSKS